MGKFQKKENMFYSVGQVAEKLGINPHTLRFYEKEGLLPFIERSTGGVRKFKQADIEWLSLIQCLKNTGMLIKDIKQFVDWIIEGDTTIDQRLNMFRAQKKKVEKQIQELHKTLDVITHKCKYYETAKTAGTTAIHDKEP